MNGPDGGTPDAQAAALLEAGEAAAEVVAATTRRDAALTRAEALQEATSAATALRAATARRDAAIVACLNAGASLRAVGALVGLSKRGVVLVAQRVEAAEKAKTLDLRDQQEGTP